MGEWHRNNPEAAEEIANLPPSEQLGAERAAMVDPLEVADQQRKEARENPPEEFSTSFEEVPGTLCPRCDGAGFVKVERDFKQCSRCDGTGLER